MLRHTQAYARFLRTEHHSHHIQHRDSHSHSMHFHRPCSSDIHRWKTSENEPTFWFTKSMIVVVPDTTAAGEPSHPTHVVSPNEKSKCVCWSTPPGITYFPSASYTSSAEEASIAPPIAAIFPSANSRSPLNSSVAVTIVPFLIEVPFSSFAPFS